MTLTEARKLYKKIKHDCRILVKRHAVMDHTERNFKIEEIIDIVRQGGYLKDNKSSQAIKDSFLLIATDELKRECKFSILFEYDEALSHYIIVCNAYREV